MQLTKTLGSLSERILKMLSQSCPLTPKSATRVSIATARIICAR
ncbi:hypothetical protein [Pseudomonas phage PaeP_Ls]|nr:hypothetical protein [Pseudomonas phage PaeP_Ls]WFG37380.1 hypothetical protein 7711_00074 [Pseudomonas phage bmx-p1]